MTISIDGVLVIRQAVSESFAVTAPIPKNLQEAFHLEIACDGPRDWATSSGDNRDLGYLLTEVRALHPGCAGPD
jgi:hypothetical protein